MSRVKASIILKMLVFFCTISLLAGCGGGGGGGSASTGGSTLEQTPDVNSLMTFTYTLETGQFNSLPTGADGIRVLLDGQVAPPVSGGTNGLIVAEGVSMPKAETFSVSIAVSAGDHTYTIQIMQGSTVLDTIGPISFKKVDGIRLSEPVISTFKNFDKDNNKTHIGTSGDDTLIDYGTSGNDRIVQYGLAGNDTLVATGNAGDDWIEQYAGDGNDLLHADSGSGDDYVYQSGGSGTSTLIVEGGTSGTQTFIQEAGQGYTTFLADDSSNDGSAYIRMKGGPAGNMMEVTGSKGNDVVIITGGAGSDSITYDITGGTDTVTIDGGAGNDLLTVNEQNVLNYTIKTSGGTLFSKGTGGTTITVANIEGIRVLDVNGATVFVWGTPPSPPAPGIPATPVASGFDKVIDDTLTSATQTDLGTNVNDRITQHSDTDNVIQSTTGGGGNDWVLQVSSGTGCQQSVNIGAGTSTVYQFSTGNGACFQSAMGVSSGIHTFVQVGGQGVNNMSVDDSANGIKGSIGKAFISQYGGPVGNTMEVYGSGDDDVIDIYGGAGNDTITYDISLGNDVVLVNGGGGTDTLTINTGGLTNFTIKDGSGNVIHASGTGGTVITVLNVQHSTVLDENGKILWSNE